MVQTAIKSWFDWKDWKDNPVFWFQRLPIWRETQAVARSALQSDHTTGLQLVGTLPDSHGEPILLACCDEIYFSRFARHLAASGHQASPELFIHIHIYEASSRCLEDAAALRRRLGDRVTFSHEPPGRSPYKTPSPFFFTSGRFAVAHHLLDKTGSPVLMIDADGIVRGNLPPEIGALASWDIGLVLRTSRRHPWRKVLASAVLFNPTPEGRLFAARVAHAIERVLRRAPTFHTDQLVLHYLSEYYRRHRGALRMTSLDERWADHNFDPRSLIWTGKGNTRKMELMAMIDSQIEHSSQDPAQPKPET